MGRSLSHSGGEPLLAKPSPSSDKVQAQREVNESKCSINQSSTEKAAGTFEPLLGTAGHVLSKIGDVPGGGRQRRRVGFELEFGVEQSPVRLLSRTLLR